MASLLVLLVGCGGMNVAARGTSAPSDPAQETTATQSAPLDPEQSAEADDPPTTDPSAACTTWSTAGDCVASGRCLWDGGCREPRDACETIRPDPSWSGEPVFERSDPCQNVRADCAWSVAQRRCVPFVGVPACPPSLTAAQSVEVHCNPSGPAPLDCACAATPRHRVTPRSRWGAPPPPPIEHPPATFTCIPPVDEQGCPTAQIRAGTRCSVGPDVACMTCRTRSTCVRGRWRVDALPPRP